jgi:MFS transporter, FHS family, L-fucose permease
MSRPGVFVLLRAPMGLVVAALLVRLMDEWWSYLPAGAIGDLREGIGISYAQAGWLLALLTIGTIVGSPLAALADHVPRRPMAVAGASLLAVGLAVYAAGAPFTGLAVASFVLGASSDVMIQPLESSLADLAGDRLDRWLGRQHVVSWAGDLIGPAVLALGAGTALGWRGAFGLTAVAMAAYALVLAVTEMPPPPRPDRALSVFADSRSLVRNRDVRRLAIADGLMISLDEAFLGFAVARLVAGGTGAASQVLAVGIFVGGVLGSLWVSRSGLSPTVRSVGPPLLVIGAVGTALAGPIPLQIVALMLVGLGTALVWARVHHRRLTAVPARSGTVAALVGILSIPAAAIPPVIGVLADRTSITAALLVLASTAIPLWYVVARLGWTTADANMPVSDD